PAQALAIADRLIATAPNLTATAVIPRLWLLRGLALAALGREVDAVAVLNAALAVPPQPPLRWRIQRALGMVSRQLGHPSAARQAFAEARRTVQQLAANIPDPNVRTHFLVASQAPPANRAGALLL
ncbi:MAG TPA: hypothetical protein VKY74_02445, partial [Chloroflexia bacterium]|nr:hypothetical protein [Chloroflexia bacterium]